MNAYVQVEFLPWENQDAYDDPLIVGPFKSAWFVREGLYVREPDGEERLFATKAENGRGWDFDGDNYDRVTIAPLSLKACNK